MIQWSASHSQFVSAFASLGMLIVWVVYLQLFMGSYRRQRRPKILINRGAGSGMEGNCLIGNLSADAIYVESVLGRLVTGDGDVERPITDMTEDEGKGAVPEPALKTRQTALQPGAVLDIGTFRGLVTRVHGSGGLPQPLDAFIRDRLQAVEITVVAAHGAEDLLAGARRRFAVVEEAGVSRVRACSTTTEQIRSRRERRRLAEMLEPEL